MRRLIFSLTVISVLLALGLASDPGLEVRSRGPRQGDPLLLVLTPPSPAVSAEGELFGRTVRFSPEGEGFVALVAVDRNQKPGPYDIKARLRLVDGSESLVVQTVNVGATEFPTQELTVDPRFVELSKEDLERAQRDSKMLNEAYASSVNERLWSGPFFKPSEGRWSALFGVRRFFNGEERSFHRGSDIASPKGTTVHCSNSGRVALVGNLFFSGNTVIVDHGLGVFTGYLHLSEIWVKQGQRIGAGDIIGLSGDTGRVTGPHLHWMLRINDVVCDPAGLLEIDFSK
ncbi:MAG TPA: M23 family metallopeptidase [Acidobacteriota bacterium]|nr:M23 family metallopeptidase [Acidobacteriota bacterium]